MAIQRRSLLAGVLALAAMVLAGPPAFGNPVNLGRITQIKNGTAKLFSVASSRVLVFRRSARKFSGFIATCPSDDTKLTAANVRGGRITCPGDSSVFNATTGARISGPATSGLEKVNLKITNGFLIATITALAKPGVPVPGATAAPTPTAGALVESSRVPVGGGLKISSSAGVLMIVQPTRGNFAAFSAICTHLGCEVTSATAKAILCTCHDSEFSTSDGARVAGPASRPLKKFEVVERNGMPFLA
jgi:nitrite reductase/ring-hydroxylating ferredoxin subunit